MSASREDAYVESMALSEEMLRLNQILAGSTTLPDPAARSAAHRAYKDGATRYKAWAVLTERTNPQLVADTDRALEARMRETLAEWRAKEAERVEAVRLQGIAAAAAEREAEKPIHVPIPKKPRIVFGNTEPEI